MKKFSKIISILFISLFALNNVYANEIFMADEEVLEEGTYDSVRFIAGNKVTSQATIDGLSFAAGNEVNLEGSTSYGLYAGNNVTVKGTIEKDLFVAGNNIIIDSTANINRDAFIAGNIIIIKTNIGRDLRVGASRIDLSGVTVNGDAYLYADEIIFDEETIIYGELKYYEDSKVTGIDKIQAGSIKKLKSPKVEVKVDIKDVINNLIVSIIASFLTMTVLFYLLPKSKERLNKTDLDLGTILKTSLIGLLLLIVVPIACIIGLVTVILMPLSLITIVVYIVSLYLSQLLVAYIIGRLINTKLFKNNNDYISLIVGIIVLKIALLIPVLGGYISILALIYGLGLIYKFITKK